MTLTATLAPALDVNALRAASARAAAAEFGCAPAVTLDAAALDALRTAAAADAAAAHRAAALDALRRTRADHFRTAPRTVTAARALDADKLTARTAAAASARAANRDRCAADADPIGTCGISDARGAALASLPDAVQTELATLAIRMCAYVVVNLDGRVDADGALDAAAVTCAAAAILTHGGLNGGASWEEFHGSMVGAVRLARHAARADRARAAQTQMGRTVRVDPSELVTLADAQIDTARCTVTRARDLLPAAFVTAVTCGAEISIVDALAAPDLSTGRAREGFASVARAAGLPVDGRARKVTQMRINRTRRALRGAGAAVRYRIVDAGMVRRARWTQDAALTAARLTYVRPALPSTMPLDALRTYEFPVTVTRV